MDGYQEPYKGTFKVSFTNEAYVQHKRALRYHQMTFNSLRLFYSEKFDNKEDVDFPFEYHPRDDNYTLRRKDFIKFLANNYIEDL